MNNEQVIKNITEARVRLAEAIDALEHINAKIKTASLQDQGFLMKFFKDERDIIEEQGIRLYKIYDFLRQVLLPSQMDDADISDITLNGVGKLKIEVSSHVSVYDGQKDHAYEWLRDHGYGSIIKEAVAPATLQATVLDHLRSKGRVPEEIFKVTTNKKVKLTKSKTI